MHIRRPIFALIIALSVLALALYGCDSGLPVSPATATVHPVSSPTPVLTPVSQPTSEVSGSINITPSDYEVAMAKWRAADVRDYRMDVTNDVALGGETSGQLTLRVRNGKIVEIYKGGTKVYVDGDDRTVPNPELNPDTLNFLTVESQFTAIKKVLDDPAGRFLTIGGDKFDLEYNIKFNETLGYPEQLGIYPINITDNDRLIRVSSLEVIEHGPNAANTVTPKVAPMDTPVAGVATKPSPLSEVVIEKGSEASKKAYDTALAKWRAAGIQEYEETVNVHGEGVEQKWTLHVNDGAVTVVSSTEGPDAKPEDIKGLWVEDQFTSMAAVLAGDDAAGVEAEGTQYYVTYIVNFDSRLSYPARFELRVQPAPIMDLGFVIEVESFTVIRRANP